MPTGTNLGTQTADFLASGFITSAGGPLDLGSIVYIVAGEGASTWVADLRGVFSSGTNIVFETTVDGINWEPAAGTMWGSTSPMLVNDVSGPGPLTYTGGVAAFQQFRVRATAINPGDNVVVTLRLSVGTNPGSGGGGSGPSTTVNQGSGAGLASAWTVKITDGVHGPVTVLPGSTAATAPNSSLVVALSPSTPLPPGDNLIGEVTLSPNPLNAQEDPNTGAQTNNLDSGTGVPLTTATTTSCVYPALGGEFYLRMTPASEHLLGVFAYQVPVGFTLYITNVVMPSPFVAQQFAGTPAGLMWELFVADSNNPSTATGVLFPLLTFGAVEGQRAGSNLSGGGVTQLFPQSPVVVPAGSWVLICYKVLGVGSSAGAFRGTCSINGYFQP